MIAVDKLLTLVNIRPNEGKLVIWVLSYGLLSEVINAVLYTVAYALFLSAFDAQHLPYIYIGSSILITLISVLFLRLSQRYALAQLLTGQMGLILLTILCYVGGLMVITNRWFLFTLPIWYGLVNTILYMTSGNLLGRLFNLQQGKRLFGLIGTGKEVAALASGFLIPGFVVLVGTINLLWVAALASGALLWLLRGMTRTYPTLWDAPATEDATADTEQEPVPAAPSTLWTDPYIRLVIGLFLVVGLGDYFIDNIFYTQIESQFATSDQLASFLALFNGAISGISLFSQLFLANWVMNRYGVRIAVLLTPILLCLGMVPFALIGSLDPTSVLLFWFIVGTNLTRYFTDTTDTISANLIYQPLPPAARTRLQTTIDGIIYPVATGVTGLLLLWLTNLLGFTAIQLAYVLVPILLLWLLMAVGLGRLYPQRVQQALRQRHLSGGGAIQPDRASLESIRQNLTNPHPGAVLYAVSVLETMDSTALAQTLPSLLTHPSVPVRLDALARLERLGGTTALATIRHLFQHDPAPAVRLVALRALATLGGVEQVEELYEYLDQADPQVRQSVMVGWLRNGELESILAAGEWLTRLVNSALPADRALAAQVLGESGLAGFYRPLLKLLQDPAPQVQRAALVAAGKLQQPKLWPMVCTLLAAIHTRSAAQTALVAGGAAVLPVLEAAFAQVGDDLQWRLMLIRTCGRIRNQQAVALLLSQISFPDSAVRTQTIYALYQCNYQAQGDERFLIEAQIQAELAHIAWTLAGLVDLAAESTTSLVYRTLEKSLVQPRNRLFLLLAFVYNATTVRRVRDALRTLQGVRHPNGPAGELVGVQGVAAEQRAYALETLDMLVAKSISRNLLPLFDDLSPAQQLKQLAVNFPQPALTPLGRLQAVIDGDPAWVSPWLKAVALYQITTQMLAAAQRMTPGNAGGNGAMPPANGHGLDGVDVLQETTAWAQTVSMHDLSTTPMKKVVHVRENGMLLTIEKVMILNTVDLFVQTPDEILIEIAALLKEIAVPADTTIFEKGEQGESMYIIVEGEVEARDGDRVFTRMGERQVFGEMALLDGEPRTATIRTTQATRLLRLDQEPFYELMDDQIDVARGVIRVLLQRLRARTNDLNALRAQLETA